MGVLSYKSQTFNDIRNEFKKNPKLSNDEKIKIIESEGFSVDDYKFAHKEHKKAIESGEDIRPFKSGVIGIGLDSSALRGVYGVIGDTAKGFAGIASIVAPETMQEIGKQYSDMMPDDAERLINELFDPYHGEGITTTGGDFASGDLEYLPRKLLSYLSATKILRKSITGSSKVIGKNKPKKINEKTATTDKELTRGQKFKKYTKEGLWLDAGVTIVDKPSESFVNTIYDSSEASRPILEGIYANPDDPLAYQYAKAALGNLAVGATLGGALWAGGTGIVIGANQIKNTKFVQQAIEIGKDNFTAYRGLDTSSPQKQAIADATIAAENGKQAILKRAEKNVQTFKTTAKNSNLEGSSVFNPKTELGLENLNKVLNNSDETLSLQLKKDYPDVFDSLNVMRDDIDEMSIILNNALGKGSTKGVIDKNLGRYLTRTYKVFDDPKYRKDLEKALERHGTNAQKNVGIDAVVAEASEQLRKQYGINDDNIMEALRSLIKYPDYDSLITDLSKQNVTGGNILSKIKLGDEDKFIRKLWGEYAEPDTNYFKSINKIAETVTQIKYLEEIDDILLKKGAYKDLPGESALKGLSPTAAKNKFNTVSKKILSEQNLDVVRTQGSALGTRVGAPEGLYNLDKYAVNRIKSRLGNNVDLVRNPLAGLYVDDPQIAKAIAKGFEPNKFDNGDGWLGWLYKGFLYGKAITQASKTAYNPSTHQVNIIGNQFMLAANGMLIDSWKNSGVAGKNIVKDLFAGYDLSKASDKELADEFEFLIKNGVLGSNVNLGMIRNTFKDMKKDGFEKFYDNVARRRDESVSVNDAIDAAYEVLGKGFAKPLNVAYKTYQAEDDIFKMMFYRSVKNQYGDALGLSGKQLDMYAAQLTRDLMPNYNLIPNFFKYVRRLPIGNFLAFPVEMLRTSKNILRQAYEDYSGKTASKFGITNPEKIEALKKLGAKRLGGMITTSAVGGTASTATASLFGISDAQQDAINNIVPDYERGTDKIYLSGINRDSNGHMGVDYYNFGLIDPYQYPKAMFKNFYALTEGAFDSDLTDTDYEKIAFAAADQVLGPYFGRSIITDFVLDMFGKEQRGVPFGEQKIEQASRAFLPPDFYRYLFKREQYDKNLEAANRVGDEYSLSDSGYSITKDDAKSMFGIRKKRLDLTANLRRQLRIIKNKKKDAGLEFTNSLSETLLNDVESEEYLFEKYSDAVEKDQEAQRYAYSTLSDYAELGITPSVTMFDGQNDFYKAMTDKRMGGFSEKELSDLAIILNNTYIPTLDPFSDNNIDRATVSNSPFLNNQRLLDKIVNKYSNIYGKKIKEK